ncbi:hypothetical protein VCRA2113O415_290025 [Vibrio crassostreae]|nr:hypothetical protein VCRA2113O415_290025 [Vibrio crassostreae]CAK2776755.1 hypothetical protein VCRA2113O420_300025 [Vibrio crassostreae]CAK3389803.1 hypothetical protein VCRA2121O436_300058 [Vibrio crassostreae]
MANVSDKSILTAAGKALLAQLNAEEKALVIDKMIFANVPNRPEYPQPDDVVPADNVVHQAAVEQRGRLSEDSVIYSTTLASNEGPFEFNWTGAYCSEYGVLVTIDHHSMTPKTVDEPGVSGNTLVRSVVLEYKDIAEITNITVDASTWQYNATPRMKKMDDDVAQANIDQNGKDWFIEEGFLVTPQASAFSIKAGAGYVSGNRVALEFDRSIQVPNKPSFIYIDAHREGTPTGEQVTLFDLVVTAEEKDDYTDANDVKHFVCKIAQVLADGSVSDLRLETESANKSYVDKSSSSVLRESVGLNNVENAYIGLAIKPLIGNGILTGDGRVWVVPNSTMKGQILPDDAELETLPSKNGIATITSGEKIKLYPWKVGKTWYVSELGVSLIKSKEENTAIVQDFFDNVVGKGDTLFFDLFPGVFFDLDPVITNKTDFKISGNWPILRTLGGKTFYFTAQKAANIFVGEIDFRGDTDEQQEIKHPWPTSEDYKHTFRIFADYEWSSGVNTEANTGLTNNYFVNTELETIRTAIHARCSRVFIGDNILVEGYESGFVFEGTAIANIGKNTKVQYCQAGWQTKADRNNSKLKCTLLTTSPGTTAEYCFVGAMQNELQDSTYYNTYFSRCCIPTVSRNTKDIKHKNSYIELCRNIVDVDGNFQRDELYEDCVLTYVHETAPFVLKAGKNDGENLNAKVEFLRPSIQINGNGKLKGQNVSKTMQIIFDRYYNYLPAGETWLFIKDEINASFNSDPLFTRNWGVRAGDSVAVAYLDDDENGSYIEIQGNGLGLDANGAVLDVYPTELVPDANSTPLRISYEYQYDDLGSGDVIPVPLAPYIGTAHKSPAIDLKATETGVWNKVERSYYAGGKQQSIPCSGGFNGVVRVRKLYISYGNGFAHNYMPTPRVRYMIGDPMYGRWIKGDEIKYFNSENATHRGAVFAGSNWRKYGKYEE